MRFPPDITVRDDQAPDPGARIAGEPPAPVPERSGPQGGVARLVRDWRIRFGLLALVWGCSFLFIKVGTEAYAPLHVALGRMIFASVVLVAVLLVRRQRLPRSGRRWAHLTVAAFFLNALPFSLFAYAELTIPSSLAGICNSTTPLWGMLLSLTALSNDRPTRRRAVGLGVGFVGVLTVLGIWQGMAGPAGMTDPIGTGMALGASLSYAVGWLYVSRTLTGSGESNLVLSGTQMLLGTAQLAVASLLFTAPPDRFALVPVLCIVALGALGTGVAFVLQYGLVAEVGPTIAQMVTYFVPIIATLLGVVALGEPFSWNVGVGALIVLLGAGLAQPKPDRRPRRPANVRTAADRASDDSSSAVPGRGPRTRSPGLVSGQLRHRRWR